MGRKRKPPSQEGGSAGALFRRFFEENPEALRPSFAEELVQEWNQAHADSSKGKAGATKKKPPRRRRRSGP